MSQTINLRLARKRKLRADKDRQASENRSKYGRTKGDKKSTAADADRASRHLDQAKLVGDT